MNGRALCIAVLALALSVVARFGRAGDPEVTGFTLLPSRPLYDPLIADPQWPRFAAEYQAYHDNPELRKVADVAFGGMLPVLQGDLVGEGRWELGVRMLEKRPQRTETRRPTQKSLLIRSNDCACITRAVTWATSFCCAPGRTA